MSHSVTQEFHLPATGGTDVVLTGEPIPTPSTIRAGLQVVHVSSSTTGSKLKVELQVTNDGVDWTPSGLAIDWSGSLHIAPGTALAYDDTALANSTACRLLVTHFATSNASLIRVAINLQEVR